MATLQRIINNWVYGAAPAAIVLAALIPLIATNWPLALTMVYIQQLPLYMLHQLEEHDDDRFRKFFNLTLGKGQELLSRQAVFLINVPGVWGVILMSLYLSVSSSIGFGMIAAYLTFVNALIHIVHAIVFRAYNPGTITAVTLFIPVGGWTIYAVSQVLADPLPWNLLGLVIAILIHAAIIIHVKVRGLRIPTRPRQRQGNAEHLSAL